MSSRRGYTARSTTPRAGSLEDPWARLRRASALVDLLENQYGVSEHLRPYPMRPEMHRNGLEYRFFLVEPVPDVEPAVPFIISECLFNLRSALDQLSYQLHVRRYRGNVPSRVEMNASFPIMREQPRGEHRGILHLGKRDRVAIKQFQPYVRRNDDLKDTRETLGALDSIHNIDKHRRLHIVRASAAPVSKSTDALALCGLRQTFFFNRPLVEGAYVERWTFTERPAEIEAHHFCWPQLVIDEPTLSVRVYVAPFLRQALGHVAATVERFNTRFGYEPWRHFWS